jgi:glycosyltransferase involved in cell wall biosynthesis
MKQVKPKIGLLHYTYPPVIGGVEVIVHEHAHLFAENGYSVTVFAGHGVSDHAKINLINIPEFQSLAVFNNDLNEKINNFPQFPQEFYELKEKITRKLEKYFKEIDIVIAHNILSLNLNPCLSFALIDYFKKNPNKKLISWIHDPIISIKNGKIVKKTFINKQLENLAYQPIQNIHYVAISNSLKEILVSIIGYPKDIITVIPNGINIQKFLNLSPLTWKIYHKYQLNKADLLIFLPSKILRHKNIDLSIKIFNEILKSKPASFLIISAEKNPHSKKYDYVNEVMQLIKILKLEKNIIFLNNEIKSFGINYDFQVIKDFYKLTDVVFFLSDHENFGLPGIEAGLNKTLTIFSEKKIFHEITSGNGVFINTQKTPKQISENILKIVNKNPSIKFFQKIKKEYDFETIFSEKIIDYINKLR